MIQEIIEDVEQRLIPPQLVVDLGHVGGQQLAGGVGVPVGTQLQVKWKPWWTWALVEVMEQHCPSWGRKHHENEGKMRVSGASKETLSLACHVWLFYHWIMYIIEHRWIPSFSWLCFLLFQVGLSETSMTRKDNDVLIINNVFIIRQVTQRKDKAHPLLLELLSASRAAHLLCTFQQQNPYLLHN